MDGLNIDNWSPQEDEFALLALGVPSVYRGFIDPRRLEELAHWLDPAAWSSFQPEGWSDVWRQFLAEVADGRRGRLVLKSPTHSFRIGALDRIYPNASYVWLVRDPTDTFFSNRKMWLAMFERYALWHWDMSNLDEFLGRAFAHAADCLGWAIRLLPKERLAILPFDQLTSAPLDSLEDLNRRLHLGNGSEMRPAIARIVADRAGYRPDTYNAGALTTMVRSGIEKLSSTQAAALASHGL
jgi:hypothetical protein